MGSSAKRPPRRLRPALPAFAAFLSALCVGASLQACGNADHSGDPALLTVSVDSTATRFSRLIVILRDSLGGDTLWNGALSDPSLLRHLPTQNYHGGPATVSLEGFMGTQKVFAEDRRFDPASRAAPRDTLVDLAAPLTRFAFDTSKVLLAFGQTRPLQLSILPAKADGRADLSLSDSEALSVSDSGRDAKGSRHYLLTARKAGTFSLIANSHFGLADTVTVQISRGTQTLLAPINRSPQWSVSSRPTWSWMSGGPGGFGFFSVHIDQDSLDTENLVNDTSYTSPAALPDGPHTLYVWERDAEGRFSPPTGMVIRVDTEVPHAPAVSPAGLAATDSAHPTWKWSPQGGGMGRYRVALDSAAFSDTSAQLDSSRYRSMDSLGPGEHVLRVEERDEAGNWSPAGLAVITVIAPDDIPPAMPRPRTQGTTPVWREALAWESGGGDGAGFYRYLIDKSDFAKDQPAEIHDSMLVPPADLDTSLAQHTLRVEERDAIGNWSEPAVFHFQAKHFARLLSLADSSFALAVDAAGTHARMARLINAPADDSAKALQKLQLWQILPQDSIPGGRLFTNPFLHVDLQAADADQLLRVVPSVGASFDSARVWIPSQAPFVGGNPPPWYYLKTPGSGIVVEAAGETVSDTSALFLKPEIAIEPRQLWLIQPITTVWWLL